MKDFQQLSLIKSHISINKIKTKIIPCPKKKKKNGIAISSRNTKLSKKQLQIAEKIYNFIKNNKKFIFKKILNKKRYEILNKLTKFGADKIDYIECVNLNKKKICKKTESKFNIFVAYYLKNIRLIDNL